METEVKNQNENGSEDGQLTPEQELEKQKQQTLEQQRLAAEAEAESERLKYENAKIKHDLAVKAALEGGVHNMGLTAYSIDAVIKLMTIGDSGIEIKRAQRGAHEPVVFVDGRETNWTAAIARFAEKRPTFFRDSIQRQPNDAELEAKAKMGNYQPPVPDDGIKAWSDFRSREQKVAWLAKNPDKIETLAPTRDGLLNNRDPYRMTVDELNQLKPAEKSAIIGKIGFAAWEKLVGRGRR